MANGYPRQPVSPSYIALIALVVACIVTEIVISVSLRSAISANRERIGDIQALGHQVCVASNEEHQIIRNALIASLTEPDVQANKPQREAYERIVRRFAKPDPC